MQPITLPCGHGERYRLPQQVLEGAWLGGSIVIWSTGPGFIVVRMKCERLEHVLRRGNPRAGGRWITVWPTNHHPVRTEMKSKSGAAALSDVETACSAPNTSWPTSRFRIGKSRMRSPRARMAEIVARIVEIEGPVPPEKIARRVGHLVRQNRRTGLKVARTVYSGPGTREDTNKDRPLPRLPEGFWMTEKQEAYPPLRNRSTAEATLRKARDGCRPPEIDAAIPWRGSRTMDLIMIDGRCPRCWRSVRGFLTGTSAEFAAAVARSVERLLQQGALVKRGETVFA